MPKAMLRDAIYRRRRFESAVIEQCVRWYVTYRLSYRDLAAMMAEQGISVTHTTIMRWVIRFVPEYERRWARFSRPVGSSWRMDETAIRVRGKLHYVYRAVDKTGKSVSSMLTSMRTVQAAKAFFRRAVETAGVGWPAKINLDKYPASHRALKLLGQEDARWRSVQVRDRRYLNNLVEQDHRAIKRRCASMLGFKSAETAAVTIAGIELAHRVRKNQFQLGRLREVRPMVAPSLKEQWERALRADASRGEAEPERNPLLHQISSSAIPKGSCAYLDDPRRYPRKVYVGHGLYLMHQPKGGRYWRYKYRYQGKERNLALGVYPFVSAELARARHLVARRFLEVGVDPGHRKVEVRRGSTESAALSAASHLPLTTVPSQ